MEESLIQYDILSQTNLYDNRGLDKIENASLFIRNYPKNIEALGSEYNILGNGDDDAAKDKTLLHLEHTAASRNRFIGFIPAGRFSTTLDNVTIVLYLRIGSSFRIHSKCDQLSAEPDEDDLPLAKVTRDRKLGINKSILLLLHFRSFPAASSSSIDDSLFRSTSSSLSQLRLFLFGKSTSLLDGFSSKPFWPESTVIR
ncbi:hypothetical protein AGLY_004318 [Aphis glycines]|uniref:Uncharacterized protein n=1 Tax=Aphis glycines TaxID=307491 RepID=A0A6G0U027_APHGL|nr:hypothetical protein AGLY_004318 [Aphis glycines]